MRNSVMVILILVAVAAISAGAVYGGRGEMGGRGGHRFEGLTEDQRAEVHALVTEMREEVATREEIRAAVHEQLAGWGIEVPERPDGEGRGERSGEGRGEGRGRRHHLMEQLSEDQRAEIHALVTGMREAKATREEIHAAVHALLESWGIELPEGCKGESGEMGTLISPAGGKSATWGKIKGDFR